MSTYKKIMPRAARVKQHDVQGFSRPRLRVNKEDKRFLLMPNQLKKYLPTKH